jgi:type VI secretion system secreted protein Hcp
MTGVGIALGFVLMAAPTSAAQVDYFLKIDGIDGESQDPQHDKWIDILSWSWGATQNRDGSVDGHDFLIWQRHSRATPLLAQALLTRQFLSSATLVGELQTSKEPVQYLKYELKNVHISSYQTGGSAGIVINSLAADGSGVGDPVPMEEISLNYEQIRYEYVRFDEATSRPLETFTGGFDATTGMFLPD